MPLLQGEEGEADPYRDALTNLLQRLVTSEERRRSNPVRPKAIPSRVFKIGENYENFSTHFVECVRVAHGFTLPTDQHSLDEACLSWLPSKLEPGPTLSAYKNLDAASKVSWPILNDALKVIFADETERETFLADVASFKRGKRSLLEYRTELVRLMTTHLPNLRHVREEYQREITARFIEGLEDDTLKRKLRRHCKRDKNTLEEAYNFVLDYETADLQTRIREGETAVLGSEVKSLSVIETAKIASSSSGSSNGAAATSGNAEMRRMQQTMENIVSKQKITDLQVQELNAKSAHTNDRIDCMAKEVTGMSDRFDSRFDKLEKLIMGTASQNAVRQPNSYAGPRPYGGRGGFRGGFRGPTASIRPSLTGGSGYVNNAVNPTGFRMQEPGSSTPVRPVTQPRTPMQQGMSVVPTPGSASATTTDANAAAAASAAPDYQQADASAHAQYEEPSWWSPGMQSLGAMGYDESYDGTYTYGNDHFQWQ